MEISQGFVDFFVWRGPKDEREAVPGVGKVCLPDLLSSAGTPLKLHFISIRDAAEAMKHADVQMLAVCAAEQHFDSITRKYGIRCIEHVMKAKPRSLIPGPVYTCHSCKPQLDDVLEGASEGTAFVGGGFVRQGTICEYDVSYYATYCDGEKLLEIDPEKYLCIIGGTQYPFPAN